MSVTAPTTTSPARRSSAPRIPSPRLRVVPPPSTRRRLPFAAVCAAVLAMSLLGLLMLNISLTRGAYDVNSLQREATLLGEREQTIAEQLAGQAAPQRLADRAAELGMVPSTNPAFIRLSDGAILGVPQPAQAPAEPTVTPPPAPSASPVTPVTPATD